MSPAVDRSYFKANGSETLCKRGRCVMTHAENQMPAWTRCITHQFQKRVLAEGANPLQKKACYSLWESDCARCSFNSLSVSRSGKSSGELGSVMIRNPA